MNPNSKGRNPTYSVGYGRPPVHSRFRKGQSGNPSGRRRYTESERAKQLLREEANRLISVREGGSVVRITALRAMIRNLLLLAAKGNASAQRTVWKVIEQLEADDRQKEPTSIVRWVIDPGEQKIDLTKLTDEQLESIIGRLDNGNSAS
jgi:transcription initiation factor IIF auxiliary subunit